MRDSGREEPSGRFRRPGKDDARATERTGSYVLVTTRTPRPPRGQSAATNNNTEDQGQDQDEEEEEEEGDWTTDASVADAYLSSNGLVLRRAFGRRGADAAKKGVDERARMTTTRSTRGRI